MYLMQFFAISFHFLPQQLLWLVAFCLQDGRLFGLNFPIFAYNSLCLKYELTSTLTDETLLTRFENFVSRCFFLAQSTFTSFLYVFSNFRDLSLLRFWVSLAVTRNVKETEVTELDLFLEELSENICFSKTLEVLKLSVYHFLISIPISGLCFPNVKILRVGMCTIDSHMAEKLFSICPVLEDLLIEICGHPVPNFNISSLTQKRLTFGIFINDPCLAKLNVMIRAPNLQRLYIDDYSLSYYTMLFLE